MTNSPPQPRAAKTMITWADTTTVWAKIGLLSFGGPAAQIALMHRLIVVENRWLNERQFLNGLSFCMLLPGPEAMQLATYTGWRLHGVIGGLIAGLLFVLPGAVIMLGLGLIYVSFGTLGLIGSIFMGIKAAIVIIVLQALIRLANKTLASPMQWGVSALGFAGIFILDLPFPLIIGLAALHGFINAYPPHAPDSKTHDPALPPVRQTLKTMLIWLGLWWGPLVAIDLFSGAPLLAAIGYFFSKLAIVTFGGAYAVLAYMAQDVVTHLGWLTAGEMMDGLGLAETTPGPLILVTEFVGFVAAFKAAGLWHGIAGAMVALWATFTPCFLWIFVGAPYLEWLTSQAQLRGALHSIMAAVVGVIANLFVWFTLQVLFAETAYHQMGPVSLLLPDLASLNWRIFGLAIIGGWMAFIRGLGLAWILGTAAAGGILIHLLADQL